MDLASFNEVGQPPFGPTLEGLRVHDLARASILSFFKRHLRHEDDGVLRQLATQCDDICESVQCESSGPAIEVQVMSCTVTLGQPVSLTVTATGQGPLSYQWLFDGTPLANATGPTLSLENVALTSAGHYSAVVTDSTGSTTSSAHVKVQP